MDLLKSENAKNVTLEFHEACIAGDLTKVTNLLMKKEMINLNQLNEENTLSEVLKKKNHADVVKILINIGVSVDGQGFLGPLHWAIGTLQLNVANILIQNGADIDAIAKVWYWTPLHMAVSKDNSEAVKLLLENGCSTEVRTNVGLTGFEKALERVFIDGIKLFAFHNK